MPINPQHLQSDIAILCSGPSLTETWPKVRRGAYRLVFAINEAGHHFEHDVFCCQDTVALEMWDPKPRYGFMGSYKLWKMLRGKSVIWPEIPAKHKNYSLPRALMGSTLFHPMAIDVYGADWAGTGSFTGPAANERVIRARAPAKWKRQRKDVSTVIACCQFQGRVRRVLPNGAEFLA